MAFVSPWIGQERPLPEAEMAVRVQERIAFRHRYGKHISLLSLSLQLCRDTDFEDVDAIATLEEAVDNLLKEWRQP